jgi:hypothetical protein
LSSDGTTLSGTVKCTGLTTDDLGVLGDFSGSLSASVCDGQLVVTVGEAKKVDFKARTDCSITS